MRVPLARLVLPYNDRLVQGARVREDPRDVRADVVLVRNQVAHPAISVNPPRHVLDRLRRAAAQGQREVELHPPADVDERVRYAKILDEVADFQFLLASRSVLLLGDGKDREGEDGTCLVVQRADAPCTGRAEIARDDALDADFLRGTDDVALLADHPPDDGADDDVCTREGLLQALDAVAQVARADLDALGTEVGHGRLGEGRGAYDGRDALDVSTNKYQVGTRDMYFGDHVNRGTYEVA